MLVQAKGIWPIYLQKDGSREAGDQVTVFFDSTIPNSGEWSNGLGLFILDETGGLEHCDKAASNLIGYCFGSSPPTKEDMDRI